MGSADIRDNDVRGVDVNEAALGKVPSAAGADTATNAANAANAAHATTASHASNADAVGGVRERAINVRLSEGTPFGQVFSYGGLVIEMGCAASGGPAGNVDFGLDTTVADAEAVAWGYFNTGAGPNVEDYSAPNDFDPGDPGALGPGVDGIAGGLYGRYEVNYVAPSGSVVTASFAVSETTNAFGGTADCILYGHARQSG